MNNNNKKIIPCNYFPSSPIKHSFFIQDEWTKKLTLYNEHYTNVTLCVHKKTKEQGALKVYFKNKMSKRELERKKTDFINEIKINYLMDGMDYIVPLWFWFETENVFGMMLKYMNNSYLLKTMYEYNNEKDIVIKILYPLLKGISLLHQHKIIHRDIKPENIFIHNSHIYIGDFGYSVILEKENVCNTLAGTITYMAPEILQKYIEKNNGLCYGYEVDIWSIGIITYELLFHVKPFGWTIYKNFSKEDPNKPEFIEKCLNTPLSIPKNMISIDAENFIECCLQKEPSKRANIDQLINHPLIIKYLKDILNGNILFRNECPSNELIVVNQNYHSPQTVMSKVKNQKKISSKWCLKNRCIMF